MPELSQRQLEMLAKVTAGRWDAEKKKFRARRDRLVAELRNSGWADIDIAEKLGVSRAYFYKAYPSKKGGAT